ncbi:MAG: alanyl-tRNA editing protein [Calditrichaeota bacterium]|nr:MAG: alanyl-tRNA editing protein [Calditrichota bacterium]
MTELLYQTDSYLKEIKARVVEVRDGALVLDRTIFYPGGGGQPCDQGKVLWSGYVARIEKVKKQGEEVLHFLSGPCPDVGQFVKCKIDWERRYGLMRTHTALHILCGVIWREFRALVTGGNMEPLKGRLDFELESMSADFAEKVEVWLNREVEAARPVRVQILPREEAFQIPDLIRTKINLLPEGIRQVRTVEIVGLDLQADGGTHVGNTKEVGRISVVGHESKGRMNKRLRIALDP